MGLRAELVGKVEWLSVGWWSVSAWVERGSECRLVDGVAESGAVECMSEYGSARWSARVWVGGGVVEWRRGGVIE